MKGAAEPNNYHICKGNKATFDFQKNIPNGMWSVSKTGTWKIKNNTIIITYTQKKSTLKGKTTTTKINERVSFGKSEILNKLDKHYNVIITGC